MRLSLYTARSLPSEILDEVTGHRVADGLLPKGNPGWCVRSGEQGGPAGAVSRLFTVPSLCSACAIEGGIATALDTRRLRRAWKSFTVTPDVPPPTGPTRALADLHGSASP
jgi:hypothetical protein